jgi:hypothetical protein
LYKTIIGLEPAREALAGYRERCGAMSDGLDGADFITLARSGATLRTRDRRAVTVTAIDAAAGLIRGSIPMEGELAWRRDGSFSDAPPGVAGPLDLVRSPESPSLPARRASLQDALNDDGAARAGAPTCCD